LAYKIINPRGKVYLKLDINENTRDAGVGSGAEARFKRFILRRCTVVSAETRKLCDYLNKNWGARIEYVPNGFYPLGDRVKFDEKENVICTSGRIGAPEKAHEDLLEAFRIAAPQIKDWKLKLMGPVQAGFEDYLANFFLSNPELKDRVSLTGNIIDRKALDQEYASAKVFCLTSKWESFGLVLVDALKDGCFIISSDTPAATDVTDNQKYGRIYQSGKVDELAKALVDVCADQQKLADLCDEIQDFAYEKFNWVKICGKINKLLDVR
jgi:glycosyltransferase involved in cell wall biosynthesis